MISFIRHFGMALLSFTLTTVLLRNGIAPRTWSFWIIIVCYMSAIILGILIGARMI